MSVFSWNRLFDLPIAVASSVLTEWLSIEYVAMLDSACCNKASRENFTHLCQQKEVSFSLINEWDANLLFEWLIRKNYKVKDCTYWVEADLSLFAELLSMTGKSLRHLDVRGESCTEMISETEFTAIVSQVALKCNNLKVVEIFFCNVVPCISDIQHANKFGLSGKLDLSCDHVLNLTQKTLTELRQLLLVDLQIRDEFLCDILSRCPLVTLLAISGCKQLTDRSLKYAVKHLQLQALDVASTNFTDESLHTIAYHCVVLETFMFEGAENFSVNAILVVIKSCMKLKRIGMGVNGISPVTFAALVAPALGSVISLVFVGELCCNEVLLAIAKHCNKLERLDISDSGADSTPNVDMYGIGYVLNHCIHLRLLVLTEGTENLFTDTALTLLRHFRPLVQLSTDINQCQLWV